jgi:hypothetical protein
MNNIARLICVLGILSLTACGGEADHAHDEGSATHAHDDGEVHANDGEQPHEHGNETHVHEAPATEAFYGDEADASEATPEPDTAEPADVHAHGDGEPHTHDH